jgi:sugar phosphate isomerase/epimerase
MSKIYIGLNAEFSRSSDKPFEGAVKAAAEMGYQYFEPMVHFGRELMSEAGYFHTVSMFDDPYRIKEACEKAGLKISGLQSHGPLGRPDVHGEYIKLAIRVAAEIGVPVVNTDEGIKAKWTSEDEDFVEETAAPELEPDEESHGLRGRLSSLIGRDLGDRSDAAEARVEPPFKSAPEPRVEDRKSVV